MKVKQRKQLSEMDSVLDSFVQDVQAMLEEAQEGYDEKSERWQESEAGEAEQERITNLECTVENLTAAKEAIESLLN